MIKKLWPLVLISVVGCSNNNSLSADNLNTVLVGPTQAYAGLRGAAGSIAITLGNNSHSLQGNQIQAAATPVGGDGVVSDIHVVASSIPAGITVEYQDAEGNLSPTGCASTTGGETCTILLTGDATGTPGNYTLQVQADNVATPLSVPLNLQWPSLALSTSSLTDSSYELELTNYSRVTMRGVQYNISSLPSGWTLNASTATCEAFQSLSYNQSCIIGTVTDSTTGGDPNSPVVIVGGDNMQATQLLTPFSPYCANHISDFVTEKSTAPYYTTATPNIDSMAGIAWGPNVNEPSTNHLIPIDGNNLSCAANTVWTEQRANAAAAYWISQKVNYCHHHVPTWLLPETINGTSYRNSTNCSTTPNLYSGPKYNQLIRWNYDGSAGQTAADWQNTNMWIGVDCSDYTSLLYNFGIQSLLNTDVAYQAGQYYTPSPSNPPAWMTTLTPNQQDPNISHVLVNAESPSSPVSSLGLVCMDGSVDSGDYCTNHGGYISVVNSSGTYNADAITPAVQANLKPGDLLYFGIGPGNSWSPTVIHVMMWTGKKVVANGDENPNGVQAQYIAPEEHCPGNVWSPQIGDWVITDSHYQGPDYRIFTSCYYGVNLWGVRRIAN